MRSRPGDPRVVVSRINLSPRFMRELMEALEENYSRWAARESIQNLPEFKGAADDPPLGADGPRTKPTRSGCSGCGRAADSAPANGCSWRHSPPRAARLTHSVAPRGRRSRLMRVAIISDIHATVTRSKRYSTTLRKARRRGLVPRRPRRLRRRTRCLREPRARARDGLPRRQPRSRGHRRRIARGLLADRGSGRALDARGDQR